MFATLRKALGEKGVIAGYYAHTFLLSRLPGDIQSDNTYIKTRGPEDAAKVITKKKWKDKLNVSFGACYSLTNERKGFSASLARVFTSVRPKRE